MSTETTHLQNFTILYKVLEAREGVGCGVDSLEKQIRKNYQAPIVEVKAVSVRLYKVLLAGIPLRNGSDG